MSILQFLKSNYVYIAFFALFLIAGLGYLFQFKRIISHLSVDKKSSPTKTYWGAFHAFGINEQTHRIVYSTAWSRFDCHISDIWQLPIYPGNEFSNDGTPINFHIILLTKVEDMPELRVNFSSKKEAQKCIISLWELHDSFNSLYSLCLQQERKIQSQKLTNSVEKIEEEVMPLEGANAGITPAQKPKIKTLKKFPNISAELKKLLSENGFTREHAHMDTSERTLEFNRACKLIFDRYYQVTGEGDFLSGDSKYVFSPALEPFFLRQTGERKPTGYTYGTLQKNITDCKKSWSPPKIKN